MKTVLDMVEGDRPLTAAISCSRGDIERRIGFPAGRFTSAGPLLAPLLAGVTTVAFFGLLSLIPDTIIAKMFTRRFVIPATIVFFTAWSIFILLIKGQKIRLQCKALSLSLLPTDSPGFVLQRSSAQSILEKLFASVDDPQKFLLTRRIHDALANLRNVGNISDVAEVLRTQADNDEASTDSSYTVIRGFIWAIPVLGFVGTVLGLSIAMAAFGGVLTSAGEMQELRGALTTVVGGLATAFETTLEGLVAALAIHMLMLMTRRREEQFLDDCKDYCQKHIIGRLRLESLE